MSQETKPVSFTTNGHPDEVQLLLALERELPPEDLNRVEQHLGNCWSCRARFDEMQRGILAFVEYREQRYLPSLPAPSGASRDFRDRLRNVLHEDSPIGLPTWVWRRLTGLLTSRQVKWVSAVALMMAIVIFWVHVLVNPRTVSANELLSRAVAAQNPPATAKTNRRRIAHQKMQIRSGKQTVIRNFEWKVGDPIEHARWETRPDPLAWNAPMTAEGFGDWRNSLLEKIDKVKRSGDRLTLDTTTDKNLIKEAWIVVRADDFHPLEQHLRFSNDQQLDFIELAFQIGDEPQLAAQSVSQAVAPPKPSRPVVPPPQVNLDESELQLRYILFTRQWDLGEDLVIGRSSNMVTLSGTVSSKEREEAMRAALSTLPEIQLSIDLPVVPGTRVSAANRAIVTKPSALSSPPLLKDVLEQTFTSREERLAFVDRCLSDSDLALSHAWALKGLVDKYSEAEEQRLKPESDAKLREMLRVHLRELGLANEGLRPLLELLPASDGAPPVLPSNWRAGIIALFNAVQQQDRLVARLVVGSQTDEQNIATASAEFESAHQAIRSLLAGLRDFAGDPAAK